MMLIAGLLSYAGLTALCLAMDRHHRQVLERAPAPQTVTVLRVIGGCLLLISLLACMRGGSGSIGIVAWFGALSIAALALTFLLPYAPRAAGGLALIAPVLALFLI